MARLPQPGGDSGDWGNILNDFLSQAHDTDGSIKAGAVSKADVGLGNVNNTADVDKPISSATQTALNAKASTSSLAAVATSGSYADLSNRPTIPTATDATTSAKGVVKLSGDLGGTADSPTVTKTYSKTDVGLGNVDNTSDANKPVSTAQAAALASKADLASGVVPDGQLPTRLSDASLSAAFVAGRVFNHDGSASTTKRLHVVLTADGTDIDDLIIEEI